MTRLGALFLAACVGLVGGFAPGSTAAPHWWRPPSQASFQVQLSGLPVDRAVPAAVYDIDLFDNPASVVAALHAAGRHVVCYLDAGTWERWRPDAGRYPRSVLGRGNGWPGERWVDVRRLDVLAPILEARLDRCAAKGFDAVEFDNVDGYANRTGFPLTASEQLAFDRWLAAQAHARGLGAGLKNDLGQVPALVSAYDFAIDEQCFQYHECERLRPFVAAGKAVFEIEYALPRSGFCPRADALGLTAMRKSLALDAWRRPCG